MHKCEVCGKTVNDALLIRGKRVCRECIADLSLEEMSTNGLDFSACI
ncbi:hypothetical protein SAMN04488589_1932 [Methanolobus vulcani]|jgi:hypothetical protein|uniref:DksA C4-type domain-containing protein n=1 Tax=Methanolobus vulcani TaxID=38026 RepID=A0A7Z7AXE0_9EURY|nr:hypothetical protein [Methanolobus vulcani]SDG01819.1 hypothetical protein SAMN04488589_1932 [Methanolobus vulcani]